MRKYLFYNDQPEGDDDDPHKDCGQKTEEIINSEEDGQVDVQRAKEYPRDAGKALKMRPQSCAQKVALKKLGGVVV